MDFSYTDGNTIDNFHVSDFGAFGQPYRLEDAAALSGSKSSCNPTWQSLHATKQYSQYGVLSCVLVHQ